MYTDKKWKMCVVDNMETLLNILAIVLAIIVILAFLGMISHNNSSNMTDYQLYGDEEKPLKNK
jgi:hypothetical protein